MVTWLTGLPATKARTSAGCHYPANPSKRWLSPQSPLCPSASQAGAERRLLSRQASGVSGDELFKAELVEVGGEVLEEVALEGVVAVAVDDLVAEGVRVELQVGLDLLLDVGVLGIELVLLGRLRAGERPIAGQG